MKGFIKVKLYSILRDLHGSDLIILPITRSTSLSEIIDKVIELSPGVKRAVELIGRENIIAIDESGRKINSKEKITSNTLIHLMPPPEGGEVEVEVGILNGNNKVSLDAILEKAKKASMNTGAIVFFIGVVRSENPDTKKVTKLSYESAIGIAEEKLREISLKIAEKYQLSYVAAFHYIGDRIPGDITMVLALAGYNREKVFPALEEIVERVKKEVPIWKKEFYIDGSYSYILGGRRISPP